MKFFFLLFSSLLILIKSLKEAAFCYEELVLLGPENHHYHNALAEVIKISFSLLFFIQFCYQKGFIFNWWI